MNRGEGFSTARRLCRVDLATREIVQVDHGGATIATADGIVVRGHTLYVVQNFLRQITELRLAGDWASAAVRSVTATPADRTFTTAKFAQGRLLLGDSRFGLSAPHPAQHRVVEMKP